MTGLQITDEKGKPLDYKRAFFRHNIAYAFSGLLFGWGFLSIARDPQKQGWHDKATGSRVWRTKNTWPIALLLLLILTGVQVYIFNKAFTNFSSGPLKNIFGGKTFAHKIRTYTVVSEASTAQPDSSKSPETVLLDNNYGQTTTVTVGTNIYILCGTLETSIEVNPPKGVIETPPGTDIYNLPNNVCWYYKAIGPGTAKITITGVLKR